MNIERLLARLEKVEPGRYGCSTGDLTAISDASGGGLAAGANCFLFGFLRGKQASAAEAREKKRRENEKHADGYGALMVLLERHMSEQGFVDWLLVRAQSLDKAYRELKEAQSHDEK